ncbi:hypothetical protein JOM56_009565 [Amanita muscaria]
MSRREHDQVDLSLIVAEPRVLRPSKRAQGLDYPESSAVKNQQQAPRKAKDAPTGDGTKHNTAAPNAQNKKSPRLEGEAVNPDGTLKDAEEITWVHLPSDPTPPPPEKRVLDDVAEDEIEGARLKRHRSFLQLHSTGGAVYEEDNDPYTGKEDGVNVDAETGGPNAKVLDEDNGDKDEVDVHEDRGNEGGGGVTESKDDDPEARKCYWEVQRKTKGISRLKKKSPATRDVQLVFKKGTCFVSNKKGSEERAGEYCQLQKGIGKAEAFFTGNVSALRTHITRFHYDAYLDLCKAKEIEPKAHAPEDWGKKKRSQQKMDSFVVAIKKVTPVPPVTKSGLKEFLLELIVDADLSFRFVERPSFLRLIQYLCPKLTMTEIPKRTCIGDAVLMKAERLDEVDRNLAKVIPAPLLPPLSLTNLAEHFLSRLNCL